MGDAGMVRILESLEWVEDRFFIAGRIYSLFNEFDLAEESFLASSTPFEALQMREDLNHLEEAISLSEELFPREMPRLSLKLAEEFEYRRDFKESRHALEKAIRFCERHATQAEENILQQCRGGIARASMYLGDIDNGIKVATQSRDTNIISQCADILQSIDKPEKAEQLNHIMRRLKENRIVDNTISVSSQK